MLIHMAMRPTNRIEGGNILFAGVVKLCQAPVYESELLLLMIDHHLHKHASHIKIKACCSHQVDLRLRIKHVSFRETWRNVQTRCFSIYVLSTGL